MRTLVLLLSSVLLPLSCDDGAAIEPPVSKTTASAASPWLQDVAQESGIEFTWHSGDSGDYYIPEIIGGGVAMLDFDNDGDLDLYFIQGGKVEVAMEDPDDNASANRLYRNEGNWRFIEVEDAAGADDHGYGMGVTTGDYDNDGDIDLYVTNVGRNTLLRNEGGHFIDVTESAGVGDTAWGSATAFLDYDADGHLDLYLGNYLAWSPETEITCYSGLGGEDYCAPGNYPLATADRLYRNRGDGTFEDVTALAGIDSHNRPALGIVAADFDQDGWLDIFIANDGKPDILWHNQGDGRFVDIGLRAGCAIDDDGKEKAGMGVGTTDIDDDGDLDLVVCNLTNESDSMFLNEGSYFIDTTAKHGVKMATRPYTRFGLGWVDLDNDGWVDLYEATGQVQRGANTPGDDPYAQENVLLKGTPGGRFEKVGVQGGTTETIRLTSRAAAFGDLDQDGRLDIIVINRDAPANVYKNIVDKPGNWCLLRVLDEHGRDALGATVSGKVGSRRLTRPVQTAHSYFAANDHRVHVGLGEAPAFQSVQVEWLDGTQEPFGDLPANQIHTLQRGQGIAFGDYPMPLD
ncbi:MAG: CRTAC1 family protein [Planctomycetota bacterium]|nr:CRTAC1 family protein [Planctomycetota bacterium]